MFGGGGLVMLATLLLGGLISPGAAAAGPLSITTAYLPTAVIAHPYAETVAATGGTAPYSWSTVPALGQGLTLNATTGRVSGTPRSLGTAHYTFIVQDSAGQRATKNFTLYVVAPLPNELVITTPSLPGATEGQFYSAPILAHGGSGPFVWAVTAGALPAGMDIAQANGTISGTPTVSGTFRFRATDNDNAGQVAAAFYTLVVAPGSGGFPWWGYLVIALVLALVIGLVAARRSRTPST
jgi:hypothetical protein